MPLNLGDIRFDRPAPTTEVISAQPTITHGCLAYLAFGRGTGKACRSSRTIDRRRNTRQLSNFTRTEVAEPVHVHHQAIADPRNGLEEARRLRRVASASRILLMMRFNR